jgi:DNA-binding MarR family transcriptional regulator
MDYARVMVRPVKRARTFSKPSTAQLGQMSRNRAAPYLAASVGRLGNLYPHWMMLKIEKKHGITSSRLIVMWLLENEESVTMGGLAQAIDLTPRAVTRIIDGLETDEYVVRMVDQNDRRVTNVALTNKGRRFLKGSFPDIVAKFESLLGVLDPKEAVELARLLEKLTDHMKKQIDEG